MRFLKFLIVATLNFALIWALNNRLEISGIPIPPLGKLLDPFQGFWQNAESTTSYYPEQYNLEGLKTKVTVTYDSLLIPHIFAQNDEDLYFMQGYITAKHRLWQMEFQTHAAAGRLSEIIGSGAINFDRTQRRKGMVFAAQNFLESIEEDPTMNIIVNAYSKGINAYINSLEEKDYPLEYKLLGYQPEAWSPLKSALFLKYMASDLAFGDRDFEYTNALKLYGEGLFNLLYPDMLSLQDPIVNGTTQWDFEPVQIDTPKVFATTELIRIEEVPDPNPDNGSNNWAVAGEKTATGNPILSSDPHLSLNLPSIWFTIQLTAPDINVKGASLPGSPNVIIGFNDSIAWGVTNARRDVVDWYKVKFKDKSRTEYLLDGEWIKSNQVIEEIKIRGQESFLDTVSYTIWGPVMYDSTFKSKRGNEHYALRWVAHAPSKEVLTFYKLNRSKNYQDYREAIRHYASPAQNFVFASASGDIAMVVQGRFPVKWENQGKFVMDGTNSQMKWQSFIPPEHNVYELNPERNFVSSANQHPVDSTYPYYVYAGSYEYYRNRRVNRRLDKMTNIKPQDLMKLQDDNYNLFAKEVLDYLLDYVHPRDLDKDEREGYDYLKDWNYFNDPREIAPTYFEAWIDELYPLAWDEMRAEDTLPLRLPSKINTFELLRDSTDFEFWDILETEEKENAQMLVTAGFKKGIERIEKWKNEHDDQLNWTNYKNTQITHLARIPALSVVGVKNGGNHNIVNATSERHGPSWRMVTELTPNGPKAWAIYPGGQSGNPGSPYYDDWVTKWADGRYHSMDLRTISDRSNSLYNLSFSPQ